MNRKISILLLFLFSISILSYSKPKISFNDLLISTEQNRALQQDARRLAGELKQPYSIQTTEGVLIDAKSVEDGKVVYAVITNAADVYNGGYAAFYEEISGLFNNKNSKQYFFGGVIKDYTGGKLDPVITSSITPDKFVMIPEWTDDKVYLFDAQTGDLLDANFIPTSNPQLQSPKHALLHFSGKYIIVADQISDVVQKFDTNGTYIGYYAPSSGPNTSVLDNIRGIAYRPNGNLLVTVGSSANQNTVQQFDTGGVSIGSFISTGLSSPFAVLIRTGDILVTNSSGANRITRHDLSGAFLSNFYTATNITFPQDIMRLPGGRLGVSAFSTPGSGFAILDSVGTYITTFSAVTGNRGAYLLGNGHYMVTNAAGVHEIDSATGTLIRTISTAANFQYVSPYNPGVLLSNGNSGNSIPVEFLLEQNYPNPFNPETSIRFHLPQSSFVTLKIYDVNGKLAATLLNGFKFAGAYNITVNGNNLSSGVYYYTLNAGNYSQTKKMVLVK